jgi:acylphosphatase
MELHVVVRGRVQGVGFRWFVREQARALGLKGWVRNRPDGAVEVAAAGPPESVARLRDMLHEGPPGASIAGVDDVHAAAGDLPDPFAIAR